MSTAKILWVWALQDRLPWALQGYSAVGLSTAGILRGWVLQGYFEVGLCRDTFPSSTPVRLRAGGEDNLDFKIEQPHCQGGE